MKIKELKQYDKEYYNWQCCYFCNKKMEPEDEIFFDLSHECSVIWCSENCRTAYYKEEENRSYEEN